MIDADKAAQLAVSAHTRIIAHASRWVARYENRIADEKAMLAVNGGTLADQNKPEKGGPAVAGPRRVAVGPTSRRWTRFLYPCSTTTATGDGSLLSPFRSTSSPA